MEVPAGQDGIQRLLAAETQAQEIVNRARKGERAAEVREGMLARPCSGSSSVGSAADAPAEREADGVPAAPLPSQPCPSLTPSPPPPPRASAAAKTERLKQAKDEAEREIGSYKAERDAEFRRKVRGGCKGRAQVRVRVRVRGDCCQSAAAPPLPPPLPTLKNLALTMVLHLFFPALPFSAVARTGQRRQQQ